MLREYLITLHDTHQLQNIGAEMALLSLLCREYQYDLHLPNTIEAIVSAAEREGGLSNINMMFPFQRWGDSVSEGYLWYLDSYESSHVIKIK